MNEQPLPLHRSARFASTTATTTAVGAIARGVCCVLPFALPAVELAGRGRREPWLGQAFCGALYSAGALAQHRVGMGCRQLHPDRTSPRPINDSCDVRRNASAWRRAPVGLTKCAAALPTGRSNTLTFSGEMRFVTSVASDSVFDGPRPEALDRPTWVSVSNGTDAARSGPYDGGE